MKPIVAILFLVLLTSACQQNVDTESEIIEDKPAILPADSIIQLSLNAHGVPVFNDYQFQFTFRDKQYGFRYYPNGFMYKRVDTLSENITHDYYTESVFWRKENGEKVELSDSIQTLYQSSINSVIYFASLPYKLADEAVIASYKGKVTIKDKECLAVEVRFAEAGGGEDHDDIFYYWFDAKSHLINYLAYSYHTNGGGVRFRSAYNRTTVKGAVFQDYVNYKVPVGTALNDIPALFEQDSLEELSRIENLDIVVAE